nr:hypothetical protein [Tanacetum cinerariifolium]
MGLMLEKTCSQWELEVPSGYSANIKNLVSMNDLKLLELDSDVTKNGPPAKMLWCLPIITKLKKLYANPTDAELLRWHAEERKTDGKMGHVTDSPQWKNIDRDFKKIGSEIRNIRFGLCSNGIIPFKILSSRHST